jgi:PIN domain nuclease of toxin-antitoxin system
VALLLDTHILLWIDQGDPRIGQSTRAAITTAVTRGEAFVCPISFWEVGMLVAKRRLALTNTLTAWRANLLRAGYRERPIDGHDTVRTASLPNMHGDPADRLLIAVAINAALTLVTADAKLLGWQGDIARMDGRM